MRTKRTLKQFILINKVEGYSYIFLVFAAMPLKYIFMYPIATKLAGMIHGVLFIIFLILLSQTIQRAKLSLKFGLGLFVASLVPFGTFYTDKLLKKRLEITTE